MFVHGNYFYGHEISQYGQENGHVDYRTLAESINHVMCNDFMSTTCDIGYWEQIHGRVDNSDEIDEIQEQIDDTQEQLDGIQEYLDELEEFDELTEAQHKEYKRLEIVRDEYQNELDELEEKRDELEDEQDREPDIFQWYITDYSGAEILGGAGEIVYYNETLDLYLWGVTHWGTSWDYVLTGIRCNVPYDEEV